MKYVSCTFGLWIGAAAWGCSSDAATTGVDGGKPASDGGADTAVADGAVSDASDGGASDAPQSVDAAVGVVCGASPCPGGDVCCAIVADGGATPSCMTGTCPPGTSIACDGPEDCVGGSGKYCCGTLQTGPGTAPSCPIVQVQTECRATCTTNIALQCPATSTLRECHRPADCADDPANNRCCTFVSAGQSSTICVSDLAAATGGGHCL